MSLETFLEKHPIKLTEQQREAVGAVDGPTLLLAVPGSGKTTVLITRLGYMIRELKIPPESILTVTYTVAATADMRNKYCRMFGESGAERLTFSTINSMALEIIRCYERFCDREAFKTQGDEKVLLGIIKELYVKFVKDYPTEGEIKDVRTRIAYAKNMMLSKSEINALDTIELPFSEIYEHYCKVLTENRWMDFDDQVVYAYRILLKHSGVLEYFRDRYTYICVDEAQDTSKLQHELIGLLAGRDHNLFMVGDEDQSIYGFRAAYPEALTEFEKIHPDARVLYMEDNFRSAANIVEAADRFIKRNKLRHNKEIRATRPAGLEVKEMRFTRRQYQYNYYLKAALNNEYETAFLYKNSEDVIPLVNLFEKNGVPYRIKGRDYSFFTHRTVTDITNIIKFADDPCNCELFMQIYYKLKTYLKREAAERACYYSKKKKMPVLDAALEYCELPSYAAKECSSLKTHLKNMLCERGDKAVYRIANFMGYNDYLEKMKMSSNAVELLEAVGEGEVTPLALLDRLEFISEKLKNADGSATGKETVVLSTIHSSKGLEYDRVVLLDVFNGILPEEPKDVRNRLPAKERKVIEEERRLFYVGMTRAKNMLTVVSYTDRESAFVSELFGGGNDNTYPKTKAKVVSGRYTSETNLKEFMEGCVPDRTVHHKKFGDGVILSCINGIVTISFHRHGVKRLALKVLFEEDLLLFKN